MKTSDFDYNIPERLIAQFPCRKRDACRLMYIDRSNHSINHDKFGDLPGLLKPGDRLVFNDTKVLPARIFCCKADTGAKIELLFTERISDISWKVLAKPAKRLKKNIRLFIEDIPQVQLEVIDIYEDGGRLVTLCNNRVVATIEELLDRSGRIPLPPYIKRESGQSDEETYQTVYAANAGAIASPTAGLHFTDVLMKKINDMGVSTSFLTLHVGIGTFRPVTESDPLKHPMHEEQYALTPQTAAEIAQTRKNGGRIIAVGTTVVRVMEHCTHLTDSKGDACRSENPVASNGKTRLMIMPGYTFKAVDGIVTNFHVPQSTLLMLVCAFAGRDFILDAYHEAVKNEYRFFSYGDAMLIL
jgi:S-adenosylmethionine:tRNA ribosyltransferase-isomerase